MLNPLYPTLWQCPHCTPQQTQPSASNIMLDSMDKKGLHTGVTAHMYINQGNAATHHSVAQHCPLGQLAPDIPGQLQLRRRGHAAPCPVLPIIRQRRQKGGLQVTAAVGHRASTTRGQRGVEAGVVELGVGPDGGGLGVRGACASTGRAVCRCQGEGAPQVGALAVLANAHAAIARRLGKHRLLLLLLEGGGVLRVLYAMVIRRVLPEHLLALVVAQMVVALVMEVWVLVLLLPCTSALRNLL
eukprot:scaffold76258_cov20-Tisochrysis_lutea.AAC.2